MWSEQMFSNPIMRPAKAAEPEIAVLVDLDRVFMYEWSHDAAYGDGNIYGRPPASLPITLNPSGLGDITGMPCMVLVKSDMWNNINPPAGWTKVLEHVSGDHVAAAWTIDSYQGQGFTGSCTPLRIPGLSGANFRLSAWLFVAGMRGSWKPVLGTPSSAALILTDPGGSHRLQWVASTVRYDSGWTPPMPLRRFGNIWSGGYVSPGVNHGWASAAYLRDPVFSGSYVSAMGGNNIPINATWGNL
jgi:hypothetical protein